MLASHRFKAASRKIINAMSHAQHGINITALGGFPPSSLRSSTSADVDPQRDAGTQTVYDREPTPLISFAARLSKLSAGGD